MSKIMIIDGNSATAEAMRQINPDVVGAFPITPTSHAPEKFSEFVNQGLVDTELILTESEHAAMSVCVGASAAGGRAMTVTGSQGLELMHEVLFNASGMRLPIVLINGNRALSAPLSIHSDHSDIMAARDTGWIQLHAKNCQEVYDLTLQAIRIAEHEYVRTPVIIAMDGFQVTHTQTKVQIENDDQVKNFLGQIIEINPLLDIDHPVTYGAAAKPDYFMECKRSQLEGLIQALDVIPAIGKEFHTNFDRDYSQHGEGFKIEDAEIVIVCLGSIFGSICEGVKTLRNQGVKIGALRLRTYRPFPEEFVQNKMANAKKIAVVERVFTGGASGGPLFQEIRSALYDNNNPPSIIPFTVSLGGREFYPRNVDDIYKIIQSDKKIQHIESHWINLR